VVRWLWLFPMLIGCSDRVPAVPDGQRCVVDGDSRWCSREVIKLKPGRFSSRRVYFQTPVGTPPEAGWPVAVLFQGSLNPARKFWEAERGDAWGAWNQVGVVQALLDGGFAVLAPDAQAGGRTFWNTNVLPWSFAWSEAPDAQLMDTLFEAMDDGRFGPLDPNRRVAAGISSGGYMTSRMALSYPGEFRALAIQSASWATCSGLVCSLPDALPADHPPTLFLHGERDEIVPIGTMERYAEALEEAGHTVQVVTDPELGHAWLEVAPEEVLSWFEEHAP